MQTVDEAADKELMQEERSTRKENSENEARDAVCDSLDEVRPLENSCRDGCVSMTVAPVIVQSETSRRPQKTQACPTLSSWLRKKPEEGCSSSHKPEVFSDKSNSTERNAETGVVQETMGEEEEVASVASLSAVTKKKNWLAAIVDDQASDDEDSNEEEEESDEQHDIKATEEMDGFIVDNVSDDEVFGSDYNCALCTSERRMGAN